LKTLTIIKECLVYRKNHNVEIVDEILGWFKTLNFSTVIQLQCSSLKSFARKCLREMKPHDIEDLIAMNALSRPGPVDFFPHPEKTSEKKIEYPHAARRD
jgi:DNA polymerase-3 subunit alpha